MHTPSVYLAGPDVFLLQAHERFTELKQKLAVHSLLGLAPFDGQVSADLDKAGLPNRIYRANVALIRQADALLVNLNAFRGTEPDSGTCFEVGFAAALGKPIVAFLDKTETYAERVFRMVGATQNASGNFVDHAENCEVENFGLPLNLMLAESVIVVTTGLDEAIKRLAQELAK